MKNLFSSTAQGLSETIDLRLLASTLFALLVLLATARGLALSESVSSSAQVTQSARP